MVISVLIPLFQNEFRVPQSRRYRIPLVREDTGECQPELTLVLRPLVCRIRTSDLHHHVCGELSWPNLFQLVALQGYYHGRICEQK